jgi:molybdate transport system ATP-binding protein
MEQDEAPKVRQFLSQDSVEEVNPFEVKTRPPGSAVSFERLSRTIAALLGINPLMGRSLPSVSHGEMRKILLARALLKRPRLLILDDAFTGLDVRFRAHLSSILEKLMTRGLVRILLIDPQPRELPRGITHILCVDRCRIAAQGPRRAMMRHPRVRELLKSRRIPPRGRESPVFSTRRQGRAQKLVHMENVSVRYEDREILSGINWTIRPGESWALVGPNGSGKSTLLSLISGDNPQAYANVIYLFGRRRGSGESVWDLKKRIGWVSSELHLHFPENQTCLETVLSGFWESTRCYRRPAARQRKTAQGVLAFFGMGSLGRSSFGSLSTGLQRMTLLTRALVKSPDLLLLDEPCQGLDFGHRDMFLRVIESLLRHKATTIVYVTHVPDEIPRGIQKILELKDGRIVQCGTIRKRGKISL